jgi:hypothetical protein
LLAEPSAAASDAALEFWESLAISNPQLFPNDDYFLSITNDIEEIKLHFDGDPRTAENKPTFGYCDSFELLVGFKRSVHWTGNQITPGPS